MTALWTGRAEGDRRPGCRGGVAAGLDAAQGIPARRWQRAEQVHAGRAAAVGVPARGGGETLWRGADALVSDDGRAGLAVATADCAPVALASRDGVFAAVHAGWRGLLAGVVGSAVEEMRALGAGAVTAGIGPCIRVECYPFGDADLETMVERFGPDVRGRAGPDAGGGRALDLVEAVRAAVAEAGATVAFDAGACTACGEGWYSHRARRERERQVLLVWREDR